MMTETEASMQLLGGYYNTLPNKVLNRVFAVNLRALAGALFIIEKFTKRWASC